MKRKLKIAIFHLAFVYSGGGEKLVLEQAKGLKNKGHKVSIFVPVIDQQKCFPEIINKFSIKSFLPLLPSVIPEHEPFQILLTCALAPFLAFRFRGFDVILAANQPSPWLAWWVKKFFGVPYVSYLAQPTRILHPRQIDQKTGLTFTKKASVSLSAKLLKKAQKFITFADKVSIRESNTILINGEYMKGVLEKIYKIKAISCPAGGYPARRTGEYAKRLKGQIKIQRKTITKPYLLLTNRHFAQKRFEYAIFTFSSLLNQFPEYSFIITGGETGYTDEVKALVGRLGLNNKVFFLDYVPEKDLKILYRHACVYLYTAPEEDFGMGIVEAMAEGTPVVAWNNAGPTKIIKNGQTGFLAKAFLSADYLNKVVRLLVKPKLAEKIGQEARKEVINKFSYQVHLKILDKYLVHAAQSR